MQRLALVLEFWYFVRYRKAYWLVPVLLSLLILALLIVLGEASALAPFIYPLF
jgi:hypothetical protein